MPQTTAIINGIDTERLRDTIDQIRQDPDLARFAFRATSQWINGFHCRTTIQNFSGAGQEVIQRDHAFSLEGDEPDILLGEDYGPNAVEVVLHALASCLTASFMSQASARGIKIDKFEMDLEGELDIRGFLALADEVRNGYQTVHITYRVQADAPRETIEELCEMAQKRSPVYDIVTNPVPVSSSLEII